MDRFRRIQSRSIYIQAVCCNSLLTATANRDFRTHELEPVRKEIRVG